jgi:hypothetical protein
MKRNFVRRHTYIHTYIHTDTHIYIHTYKHTYIHTYINTCISTCVSDVTCLAYQVKNVYEFLNTLCKCSSRDSICTEEVGSDLCYVSRYHAATPICKEGCNWKGVAASTYDGRESCIPTCYQFVASVERSMALLF